MNCLFCGKPITPNDSSDSQWHTHCIQKFFGTEQLPQLQLTNEELEKLAQNTVAKGFTIPGVQRKLSLHLSKETGLRLTLIDYPAGYILKPQSTQFKALPELEKTAMDLAAACGIHTVDNALLEHNGHYAYITKRIDRLDTKKLAMEDFAQLTGKLTSQKYNGSYEQIGKTIKKYSAQPGLDLVRFFEVVLFSFLIGNSDMHLKNFSLIETEFQSRKYTLSRIYDILPTNVILPTDKEEMALTVNGKKKNLHPKDFAKLATTIGLTPTQTQRITRKLCQTLTKTYPTLLKASYAPKETITQWQTLIRHRLSLFSTPGQ